MGYKRNPLTVTIVIEVKYGTEYIISISWQRLYQIGDFMFSYQFALFKQINNFFQETTYGVTRKQFFLPSVANFHTSF
jgi:hypothetical protein